MSIVSAQTFYTADIESSSLKPIQAWMHEHPTDSCIIYVTPQVGLQTYMTNWYTWLLYKKNKYTHHSKIASYSTWIVSGITCMSYFSIVYTMYRAYKIILKLNGILQLFNSDDAESLELFVRSFYKNHYHFPCNKQDEAILLLYLKMHTFLKKIHMRWMFPYQQKAHQDIVWYILLIKKSRTLLYK